jgi:hypothetical protein
MPKLLVIAEVEDRAQWEESFRTHDVLFRSLRVFASPIRFGTNHNNEVAVLEDVDTIERALATFRVPEVIEAMKIDGVKRETVKDFIIDKELSF